MNQKSELLSDFQKVLKATANRFLEFYLSLEYIIKAYSNTLVFAVNWFAVCLFKWFLIGWSKSSDALFWILVKLTPVNSWVEKQNLKTV